MSPNQLTILLGVKLFNINVVHRNINKTKCAGHMLATHSFVCNLLTYMDSYVWQFVIFNLDSLLSYGYIYIYSSGRKIQTQIIY